MLNACDHFQRIPWKLHFLLLQGWDLWRFLDGYPLGIKSVNGKLRLPNDNQNRKELGWSISNSSIPKHVQKYACIYIYNMYIGWCCTFQFHYSFLRDVLYVENSPSRRDTVGQCRVTPTLFTGEPPISPGFWEFILGNWELPFCNGWCSSMDFHHVFLWKKNDKKIARLWKGESQTQRN